MKPLKRGLCPQLRRNIEIVSDGERNRERERGVGWREGRGRWRAIKRE